MNLRSPELASFADPFTQYNKAVILYQARRSHQNTTLALWENPYLKNAGWKCMIWFTKNNICTINEYDGDARKISDKNEIKPKKKTVWLPSHVYIYNMKADSFPVFLETENKPDLP